MQSFKFCEQFKVYIVFFDKGSASARTIISAGSYILWQGSDVVARCVNRRACDTNLMTKNIKLLSDLELLHKLMFFE